MQFTVKLGYKIIAYTSTFPAQRYWYRHDTVFADGVKLEGFVQVQQWATEVTTHFTDKLGQSMCVIGRDYEWLYRMNHAIPQETIEELRCLNGWS